MNFALLLFVLLVVTGVVALIDRHLFARRRQEALQTAQASASARVTRRPGEGEDAYIARRSGEIERMAKAYREPWWVEYSKSFFPVILIVFLLRSFLVEPFKIPSGSMLPTLFIGDFILVNKFTYGIRLPIINKKIVDMGQPTRGDVMVFRYPKDTSVDYIKRVIGLPGDRIAYMNKRLSINGKEVPLASKGEFVNRERYQVSRQFEENLNGRRHFILLDDDAPPMPGINESFPHRENCHYTREGVTCTVPPGHYFMMGDNRDNSQDSRIWGFVPDENIVGKAFFIWLNLSDLKRFGSFQ